MKKYILLLLPLFFLAGCGNTEPVVEPYVMVEDAPIAYLPWDSPHLRDGSYNEGDQFCFEVIELTDEGVNFDLKKCK